MSVEEILSEMDNLQANELRLVLEKATALSGGTIELSPELAAAIDEAMAVPENQYIALDEVERIVKTWRTK
jgi:hypothetical protein